MKYTNLGDDSAMDASRVSGFIIIKELEIESLMFDEHNREITIEVKKHECEEETE